YKKYFPENCIFINGLGPTESTVTLQYFIDKKTTLTREAVPVGYAVADTGVLLIDEKGNETVGSGVGEILYKSHHLAPGYLNLPEKTAEAFVKNPLTGKDGGDQSFRCDRVYRSGDLGRRLPDGSIEYAGRKDFQVKIRGYRVEPGEIEGLLDNVPGVRKSAVVSKQNQEDENYLIAFYVLSEEDNVEPDDMKLLQHLQGELPTYMVPGAIYKLKEFPLTPTGKIDRKALTQSAAAQKHANAAEVPSLTPIQEALAGIWKEILKIDNPAIHDNFFTVGGHSLNAILLVSKIHKQFAVKMPLAEIF
ncbi:MAG: non-ribosomal peptide synthetase, partial [bacterium]|nr:non-ribosomal peptide synthetase [bacterium]